MTTMELAQRLARHMRTPDVATMASDEAMALLDSANAGLQKLFAAIPAVYRRTIVTATLRAPRTTSIALTQYSVNVPDATFTDDERGCTVRLTGDVSDNQIASPNKLLAAYLGPTGTVPATVYNDALSISEEIHSVTSMPRLHTGDVLFRADQIKQRCWWNASTKQAGCPDEFYMSPVGVSQDGSPMVLLRVHPMPLQDYRLEMELELQPKRLTFLNMQRAEHLPVPPALVESGLLPLCEWELAGTRYWTSDRTAVEARRTDALRFLENNVPHDILPPDNCVGTPYGF